MMSFAHQPPARPLTPHLVLPLTFTLLALLHAPLPVFADNTLTYYFLEEHPSHTLIGDLINDYGLNRRYNQSVLDTLRFSILLQAGLDRQYVEVEERSGVIRSTHRIDRERICPRLDECVVKFDVAVKPHQHFQIIKVKVNVLDLNDNSPTFPERRVLQRVSESAELGSGFTIPGAADLDSGRNGIQRYEVVPPRGKFELRVSRRSVAGGTDLRLILREGLDREAEERHLVTVFATDGGDPPRTGSIVVDIVVLDANDNNPVFENSSYQAMVLESAPTGSVLLQVKAVDADSGQNGAVAYGFSAHTQLECGELFGIHADTGRIHLRKPLDFETSRMHVLSVTATDQGPDSLPAVAAVAVRVVDINDNAPRISVKTLDGGAAGSVEEHADPGIFVAHVSVLDVDSGENGRVRCAVDSAQFRLATLYHNEFQLVTVSRLDREQRDLYVVTVMCRDHGHVALTSSVALRVRVADINDQTPRFVANAVNVMVEENLEVGHEVMRALAVDDDIGDNARVTYSLSANIDSYLRIDDVTGAVTINRAMDREVIDAFAFQVTARDAGVPPLSTTITIFLTVLDADDELPMFPFSLYTFSVLENEAPGTAVGVVSAVDRDLPPNNQFSYHIEQTQPPSELFAVDQAGVLTTRGVLDREGCTAHHLRVVASAPGGMGGVTASVVVQVSDVNDNRPVFGYPAGGNETVSVSSLAPPGHVVGHVRAEDEDSGANRNVTYVIVGGNARHYLTLDAVTGALRVNRKLSSVEHEELVLSLTATDGGTPQLWSSAELRVVISRDIAYVPSLSVGSGGSAQSSQRRRSLLANEGTIIILAVTFACVLVAIAIFAGVAVLARRGKTRSRGRLVGGKKGNGAWLGGSGSSGLGDNAVTKGEKVCGNNSVDSVMNVIEVSDTLVSLKCNGASECELARSLSDLDCCDCCGGDGRALMRGVPFTELKQDLMRHGNSQQNGSVTLCGVQREHTAVPWRPPLNDSFTARPVVAFIWNQRDQSPGGLHHVAGHMTDHMPGHVTDALLPWNSETAEQGFDIVSSDRLCHPAPPMRSRGFPLTSHVTSTPCSTGVQSWGGDRPCDGRPWGAGARALFSFPAGSTLHRPAFLHGTRRVGDIA